MNQVKVHHIFIIYVNECRKMFTSILNMPIIQSQFCTQTLIFSPSRLSNMFQIKGKSNCY